ncbi:MAG: hypothetical protein AAF367_01590 [Pseudomonadota bacterium]
MPDKQDRISSEKKTDLWKGFRKDSERYSLSALKPAWLLIGIYCTALLQNYAEFALIAASLGVILMVGIFLCVSRSIQYADAYYADIKDKLPMPERPLLGISHSRLAAALPIYCAYVFSMAAGFALHHVT